MKRQTAMAMGFLLASAAQTLGGEAGLELAATLNGVEVTIQLQAHSPQTIPSPPPSGHARDTDNGCFYRIPTDPPAGPRATWSGACDSQGFATGEGELRFGYDGAPAPRSYDFIRGEFVNGRLEGVGIKVLHNGAYLAGTFRNDRLNGRGEMRKASGEIHEGAFVDGKAHGQGKRVYRDGKVAIGEFADGRVNGKARVELPSGAIFVGQFRKNQLHGGATLRTASGQILVGEWVNNVRHGEFEIIEPSGQCRAVTYSNGDARPAREPDCLCTLIGSDCQPGTLH